MILTNLLTYEEEDNSFFFCLIYVNLLCGRLFELCTEAVGSVIKLSMDSSAAGENSRLLKSERKATLLPLKLSHLVMKLGISEGILQFLS